MVTMEPEGEESQLESIPIARTGAGGVHVHKTCKHKYCLAYRQGAIGIET